MTQLEKDLKLALKASFEHIPEGIILVKSDKAARINYIFEDLSRELAEDGIKYAFVFAPTTWDGKWEKVSPAILKQTLQQLDYLP